MRGPILESDGVTLNDNQIIRGFKIFAGKHGFKPRTTQTLAATDSSVVEESYVKVAGSGGAVTLTSEPTIADGEDGQEVLIRGTHDTNTVTIQDISSLATSNVDLGGADRTLGASDYLKLSFNEDTGNWEELFFKNN